MDRQVAGMLAVVITALGVAGCGGGGADGTSFTGIDRLGVSSGTITGFGSIFVNGVEWDTSRSNIEVRGRPASESDLRLGQVVVVRGRLDADRRTGRAESVTSSNMVEGRVATVDPAARRLVVLGQDVRVVASTVFDAGIDGGLAGLAAGDPVAISGYRDSADTIRATRIERRQPGSEAEVKGRVSNLDAANHVFMIGSLSVNYAGATLEDFGSTTLANGLLVEVEGLFADGVLSATSVELEDALPGGVGGKASLEIEGYVTTVLSATEFEVAGVRVMTRARTRFEHGTADDLVVDAKVEVEGKLNEAGVLVADEVEFQVPDEEGNVEVDGPVGAIDAAAGTLWVEGVLVRTGPKTQWRDDSSAGVVAFGLADLAVGDYVEVRGGEDPSPEAHDMIAIRIERTNPDDDATLRGPVQLKAPPELVVLGITIRTDAAVFMDRDGQPIDAATFFATVQVGDIVEASTNSLADFNGNSFIAEEVSLDDAE